MKRNTYKKIASFILAFTVMISCFPHAKAESISLQTYLETVREIDSNFLKEETIDSVSVSYLVTPWGEGQLVDFLRDEKTVAYAIFVAGTLLEFAESESPYASMDRKNGECRYYDFANYAIIDNVEANKRLNNPDQRTLVKKENPSKGNWTDPEEKLLSGVSPQLQNGSNCIVAALSNVIWYWKGHGHSSLASGMTFANVKTAVNTLFGGNYANNRVLAVANQYGSLHGNKHFTGGALWGASVSAVYSEINAGYPCMVGFAAGSYYSSSVGHMTMCVGYYYDGDSTWYVRLADGWSSSVVTRLWTSYNDCVIKLRID